MAGWATSVCHQFSRREHQCAGAIEGPEFFLKCGILLHAGWRAAGNICSRGLDEPDDLGARDDEHGSSQRRIINQRSAWIRVPLAILSSGKDTMMAQASPRSFKRASVQPYSAVSWSTTSPFFNSGGGLPRYRFPFPGGCTGRDLRRACPSLQEYDRRCYRKRRSAGCAAECENECAT